MNPPSLTMSDDERRAVKELKKLVEEAIRSHQLMHDVVPGADEARIPLLALDHCHRDNNVSIWGVPLLKDERTDVILLKFLQDNKFRVRDSFKTIKNTVRWRHQFGVDNDYNSEADVYIRSDVDKEGRPVCYNMLHTNFPYMKSNSFFNKDERILMRERFIRSWILSVERMIRELIGFQPDHVNAIFQVNDLDKCSRSWLRELNHLIPLLQDYYPQSIANQVFINTPLFHQIYIMRSKFLFSGTTALDTANTLFKYISPGNVPIPYGGYSDDLCNSKHFAQNGGV